MTAIEIARRMAELGQTKDACKAYSLAIQENNGADPAQDMEAAIYLLQQGRGYHTAFVCFAGLYNRGCFQEDCLSILTEAFYAPNIKEQQTRYERNRALLKKYPYIFRTDFPEFDALPIKFFPFDDESFLPLDVRKNRFGTRVMPEKQVVSRNFFKELDKPILATDVFSQYELEYLNDNVRPSEYIARENHVYLHYADWETFCSWLQVLNLRPLLKEEKVVFLIGDEISQYPIDFKERFGIDYSQYEIKPLALREINKLIWHTQLSAHNGGDFFNEIFDAHPNLLPLTSIMFDSMEKSVAEWRKALYQAKGSKEVRLNFLRQKRLNNWVIQELCNIPKPTDKDIFAAIYLSSKEITKFVDPVARIAPAVFFQPHFPNITCTLTVNERGHTVLNTKQYDQISKSHIFRGFKYIKTFTPLRRFTTSHGASLKFLYNNVKKKQEQHHEGKEKEKKISVAGDMVSERVLNRCFMIDPRDRLYTDSVLVRFEDGKLNPKATFTALAAFLDLPYTESMTYCSLNGELNPTSMEGNVLGFDTATVYRTYDEYVNDSERKYIEYFLRDAYEFYGYGFQCYDGQPVTLERVNEWLKDFSTVDYYLREIWKSAYEKIKASIEDQPAQEETLQQVRQQLLEKQLDAFHKNREKNSSVLMHARLQFLNRNGQPLRMMSKLKLDPELLEQPLYH